MSAEQVSLATRMSRYLGLSEGDLPLRTQIVEVLLRVAALVLIFIGFFAGDFDPERGFGRKLIGPEWVIVVGGAGFILYAALEGFLAWKRRTLQNAVMTVIFLFAAFSWWVPRGGIDRPSWATVISLILLALLVGVALPLLIALWRSTQDERERVIFASATTIAFLVVMFAVAGFAALDVLAGDLSFSLTPTWVLLGGLVSWGGSMFVLRAKM